METLNSLLVKDKSQLSQEESMFLGLHEVIMYAGSTASLYIVEFAKRLKEMRDSKLYEKVGYTTFGEYVEQAVNIKQRQAYKYIEVYENFSEDFLIQNSKLGITKLLLLSNLNEEDKAQVAIEAIENDLTVEDLKKIIAEKESKISQLQLDIGKVHEKKITEANKKADKAKKDLEKAIKEKDELYKKYEELKNAPAKVDVVDNPETLNKLKEVSLQLQEKQEEIIKLKKKTDLASNSKLMVFKVKFEELQVYLSGIKSLIDEMESSDKDKCNKALKAVMGAYL
ncbi:MAG: DUF3102 domain-containing protein [Clostridia bacterium]|nr:DUF3102 domain-containing protein [Clostridia bacterium]